MYIPSTFKNDDRSTAWSLVEEIRLGSLITVGDTPLVSHLPFMVDRDRGLQGVLVSHMARNNPQWRDFASHPEVLVTFIGPNTYISPGWYSTSPRAPTWNFVSIHVYGRCRLVDDEESRKSMVKRLSAVMETPDSGWTIERLDPSYIDKLIPAIVGFEIDVDSVETQLRLSQQNNIEDRNRVYQALSAGGLRQKQVAELMERFSFLDVTGPAISTV
jgi:transcriptional regulator